MYISDEANQTFISPLVIIYKWLKVFLLISLYSFCRAAGNSFTFATVLKEDTNENFLLTFKC